MNAPRPAPPATPSDPAAPSDPADEVRTPARRPSTITLVVTTEAMPPTPLLLAGIAALSALDVRRVTLGSSPLRYTIDLAGHVHPESLAAVLGEVLRLPVHVQAEGPPARPTAR